MEESSCTYENQIFEHGSVACLDRKCVKCNDGNWEYSSESECC